MSKKDNKVKRMRTDMIVDVSNRINIRIEREDAFVECDIERLRKELDAISELVGKTYYDSNLEIERIRRRSFLDLFKMYIDMMKPVEKQKKIEVKSVVK